MGASKKVPSKHGPGDSLDLSGIQGCSECLGQHQQQEDAGCGEGAQRLSSRSLHTVFLGVPFSGGGLLWMQDVFSSSQDNSKEQPWTL